MPLEVSVLGRMFLSLSLASVFVTCSDQTALWFALRLSAVRALEVAAQIDPSDA